MQPMIINYVIKNDGTLYVTILLPYPHITSLGFISILFIEMKKKGSVDVSYPGCGEGL